MEEKKIVINKPVSVAGLNLIPVTQVSLGLWSARAGEAFLAIKQPIAVVVVSSQKNRAFRMTGEEVLLEELVQEYPGLKDYL